MSQGIRRDFDKVAASWDEKPLRRLLAAAVSAGIAADVPLHRGMQVLEYGCGTGLCGLQLASEVGHLAGSRHLRWNAGRAAKKNPVTRPGERDTDPDRAGFLDAACSAYDLVFSSMVLHHIEATQTLLKHFQQSLKPGGFLALADLEKEDGTFHDDPTGIAHHGFDPQELITMLKELGFADLTARTVHTMRKQHGDNERTYPVFLITGQKPR